MVEQEAVVNPISAEEKVKRYAESKVALEAYLAEAERTEEEKQEQISQILSDKFPEFSFVGFYDAKAGKNKVYIGEFVSSAGIFPCGEIVIGKGQCGLCAETKKGHITYDTKQLDNYIACDIYTRSEIVLPCFEKGSSR